MNCAVRPVIYPLFSHCRRSNLAALRFSSSTLEPTKTENQHPVDEKEEIFYQPENEAYRPPSTFQDTRTLFLQSGAGGHGCVSFLREKFIANGPPNGGDGGKGGDIYIKAVEGETSLHKLGRTGIIIAGRGAHGQGSAKNGKNGKDVIISVPVGTIVREIERIEGGLNKTETLGEDYAESDELSSERKAEDDTELPRQRLRPRRFAKQNVDDPKSLFIHYPLSMAHNLASANFPPPIPSRYYAQPQPPVHTKIDLSVPTKTPILLLRGSAGGLGNPNFVTSANRIPKYATKGGPSSRMKITLEIKLLADIGLVGRPNAGKSSLLRCLTASRARVGNWAFTTLVPNVGTVVLDRGLGMGDDIVNGTSRERFTIADIPGLIRDAGNDKGLGWDFLRHVERAKGLAFVIDLSSHDPVEELQSLWIDIKGYENMRLEQYRADKTAPVMWNGPNTYLPPPPTPIDEITTKPWMVIANKADINSTREKFFKLKKYLADTYPGEKIGCLPVSALRAGCWNPGEFEKEEGSWKAVGGWMRSLVG